MSFASTLYLVPILDVLLEKIPSHWHMEVRLGLQEALVNAAKHGNQMDPAKQVEVEYSITNNECCWVIKDQGCGFEPPTVCNVYEPESWICDEQECGRGLFILYQVFDYVEWSPCGTELRLSKQIQNIERMPWVA